MKKKQGVTPTITGAVIEQLLQEKEETGASPGEACARVFSSIFANECPDGFGSINRTEQVNLLEVFAFAPGFCRAKDTQAGRARRVLRDP
jgi:hypothetical protein